MMARAAKGSTIELEHGERDMEGGEGIVRGAEMVEDGRNGGI